MRVLKESFDALVQHHIEGLTNDYMDMHQSLLSELVNLRKSPSPETLHNVVNSTEFNDTFLELFATIGQHASMTVAYLKDMSSLLALVSSVREGDIDRHLQAEKGMLKQVCL